MGNTTIQYLPTDVVRPALDAMGLRSTYLVGLHRINVSSVSMGATSDYYRVIFGGVGVVFGSIRVEFVPPCTCLNLSTFIYAYLYLHLSVMDFFWKLPIDICFLVCII